MRCEGCDRELPEGARFCATCGTPVPGLERAAELVQLASTSGLVQPIGTGNVPDIPEPAPLPAEQLTIAEPAAIPAPAPLPGEAVAEIDVSMATPTYEPSSAAARETLERYRREAAELLTEGLEEEIEERIGERLEAITPPEHTGMGRAPQGRMIDVEYEEGGPFAPPPPPPPPAEAGRPEHVAMGERSLTASMVSPGERRRVRGDLLADSIRPRTTEQVREDSEATGGKCCAYGCVTLAILVALFILGLLMLQQADERRPPPSARAPAAVERVIAQAVDASAAASQGHRGMMPDARERQHAYSPSPTDGRMPDHVLHELRQGDA